MQLFVADVHMRPHAPQDQQRFLAWLESARPQAEKIYILGDLFEYWYSGLEDITADVIAALADPAIHILPGNRDFLLVNSSAFPGLLPGEETIIAPYGKRLLITHGHMLVTGDHGFKVLHALGWPLLRRLDARLPVRWKRAWAESLVRSSAVIRPPQGIINPKIAACRGVDTVICGHLHRGFLTPELIVVPAFCDAPVCLALDEHGARFVGD